MAAKFRQLFLFLLSTVWLAQSVAAMVPMPMAGGENKGPEWQQHQLFSDSATAEIESENSHHDSSRCIDQHCAGGHNCIDGHCTPVAAISSEVLAVQVLPAALSLECDDRPVSSNTSFFRPPIIS